VIQTLGYSQDEERCHRDGYVDPADSAWSLTRLRDPLEDGQDPDGQGGRARHIEGEVKKTVYTGGTEHPVKA
jgi:hypothetical protein